MTFVCCWCNVQIGSMFSPSDLSPDSRDLISRLESGTGAVPGAGPPPPSPSSQPSRGEHDEDEDGEVSKDGDAAVKQEGLAAAGGDSGGDGRRGAGSIETPEVSRSLSR